MSDTRSIEARKLDQEKMGKVPAGSFYLLTMLRKKRISEKKIRSIFENHDFKGYHLHSSSLAPDDRDVRENQLHIFIKDGLLCTKHRNAKGVQEVKLYRQHLENNYDEIKNKLIKNIPLSFHEVNTIMKVFKKNNVIPVPVLAQNTHPLLQTIDDYIVSMERKKNGGHVNGDMANDKINFSKILRTFIEHPTETNWHDVRAAMKKYPRYGFSWTGISQADYFLTVIKIQYQKTIKEYDVTYDTDHKNEANTSWGRFLYHFGFAYYIPSFFLAIYKLVQFIYHESAKKHYHSQLINIKTDIETLFQLNSAFSKQANTIIDNLECYLNGNELQLNEDTVTYIDEIESHLTTLDKMIVNEDKHLIDSIKNDIKEVSVAVKKLITRPIPLRDMSYLNVTASYK